MSRDTEADFLAAYRRLSIGAPNDHGLRQRAALGSLQINISTLAKEAGHSRTLIGMRNTKYPNVRALIFPNEKTPVDLEGKRKKNVSGRRLTQRDLIEILRSEHEALTLERDRLATKLAETDIALALCRKENEALRSRIERFEKS